MMKALCNFMFGGHSKCEEQLHMALNKSVKSTQDVITDLTTQIQELKAMNHYQAIDFDNQLKAAKENAEYWVNDSMKLAEINGELLKENEALKDKIDARKKRRAEKMKARKDKKVEDGK